jgi:hypothetical protein
MEAIGQLHAQATLPPEKILRYPLDKRLGGSQSRYGRGDEEKKIPAPFGNRTPIIQHVAQSVNWRSLPARVIIKY